MLAMTPEQFEEQIQAAVKKAIASAKEPEEEYLRPIEAASFCGVDVSTIHRWQKAGKIQKYRIGKTNVVRYKKHELRRMAKWENK